MKRTSGYVWHLRQIMAARGMFATSDLHPLLAERGINLSREQVYRLVVQTPQRRSLDILAALCHILDCGPQDLIEVKVINEQIRKEATTGSNIRELPTTRTVVRRPDGL